MKRERVILDDKIAGLEEKRRILVPEEEMGAQEVSQLRGDMKALRKKKWANLHNGYR
jgi:hypothetical protein